jgi:uncharacterized protein (DUF58 family)
VYAFYLPVLTMLLILYDYLKAPNPGLLRALLTPPQILSVGSPEPFPITVTLEGRNDVLKIKAILEVKGTIKVSIDDSDAHSEENFKTEDGRSELDLKSTASVFILKDGKGDLKLTLNPFRRGWAYIDKLWLSFRGPLGFLEIRHKIWIGQNLTVIQDIKTVRQEALFYYNPEFTIGQKSHPFLGDGTEFENLTDYAAGMDYRFIDWKHSARHRKLLAKEFRQERNQHIILGFDTGRLMNEPINKDTRLDNFIRAGLALAFVSLRSGDLVGACGFDLYFRDFLPPGRSASFFGKLQKFTSNLNYTPEETNFTLSLTELAAKLRKRSLVVLFTEFSDSASATLLLECLELFAQRHTVIFVSIPDPITESLKNKSPGSFLSMAEAVIADKFQKERAIVLESMTRLGVHTLDHKETNISSALINRYLAIKKRGLI